MNNNYNLQTNEGNWNIFNVNIKKYAIQPLVW